MKIGLRLWFKLLWGLRFRGRGVRESGAFLIGSNKRVKDVIFYDDLDPHSLDTGIIEFSGIGHLKLWDILKERKMEILADIHTHPGASTQQSYSDQTHPMVRIKGHIALIAPNYGRFPFYKMELCSAYLYLGDFQWRPLRHNSYPFKFSLL